MTNKDAILDLGPVEQFEIHNDGYMLYNGNRLTYKELERMANTARTQGAGLMAVQEKTKRVQVAIGEISLSGVSVFDSYIVRMMAIRDKHRKSSEQYHWVSSFFDQVGKEFGMATLQAIRIGEKWLLQILYTSPFPPSKKRKLPEPTWIDRLLGRHYQDDGDEDY